MKGVSIDHHPPNPVYRQSYGQSPSGRQSSTENRSKRNPSRESRERANKKEREEGFNTLLAGANEQRIKDQQAAKQFMRRGNNSRSGSRGAQRELQKKVSEERSKYQNPFEVAMNKDDSQGVEPMPGTTFSNNSNVPKRPANLPSGKRRGWGEPAKIDVPAQVVSEVSVFEKKPPKKQGLASDDEYEDDEFIEDEAKMHENTPPHVQKQDKQIEQLLRTATAEQIDMLKQSIASNFGQEKSRWIQDESSYIEDELMDTVDVIDEEEDIPETVDEEDSSQEDDREEEMLAKRRREDEIKRAQMGSRKLMRPVSATYDLTKKRNQESQMALKKIDSQVTQESVVEAMKRENQVIAANRGISARIQPSQPQAYANSAKFHQNEQIKTNTGPTAYATQTNVVFQQNQQQFAQSTNIQKTHLQPSQPVKATENFYGSVASNSTLGRATGTIPTGAFNEPRPQSSDVEHVLNRIYQMDDTKRKQLISMLKGLEENGSLDGGVDQLNVALSKFMSTKDSQPIKPVPKPATAKRNMMPVAKKVQKPIVKRTVDYKEEVPKVVASPAPVEGTKIRSRNELIIKVLSTFGHPHVCGLTEIELFDNNGEKIPLVPSCLMVRNLGKGPKVSLDRLINMTKATNDARNMWHGYLPGRPNNLELQIFYSKEANLAGIRIWNYNKSILDCTKGAKRVHIFVNDEKRWEGDCTVGKGQADVDYSTKVLITKDKTAQDIFPQEEGTSTRSTGNSTLTPSTNKNSSQDAKAQNLAAVNQKLQIGQGEEQKYREMNKYQSQALIPHSQIEVDDEADGKQPIWLAQKPGNNGGGSSINLLKKSDNEQKSPIRQRVSEYRTSPMKLPTTQRSQALRSTKNFPEQQPYGKRSSPYRQPKANPDKPAQSSRPSVYRGNKAGGPSLENIHVEDVQEARGRNQNLQVSQASTKNKRSPSPSKEQCDEAVNQIRNTVDSVNRLLDDSSKKAYGGNSSLRKHGDTLNRMQKKLGIEESLDSLDFFKVTNLGRFNPDKPHQTQSQFTEPIQEEVRQHMDVLEQKSTMSQASSRKGGKPQVVRNPFPEDFAYPSPAKRQQQRSKWSAVDVEKQSDPRRKVQDIMEDSLYQDFPKPTISPAPIIKEQLVIPTLPFGQNLVFNVQNTWGDMNYLGLTGIEVFDVEGNSIPIENVTACPPDINILPGYGEDPRTVDKLVDGHYFTNDDLHVWLTPFTLGEEHTISIDLGEKKYISLIRVWNYNKSRIHSYRGARSIECHLDEQLIFRGEIKKAPGNTKDPEQCCEMILFTDNDKILEKIDAKDWLNEQPMESGLDETQRINENTWQESVGHEERPMTATKKFSTSEIEEMQFAVLQQQQKPTSMFDERPQTSAIIQPPQAIGQKITEPPRNTEKHESLKKEKAYADVPQHIKGQSIWMNITESWGDLFYVGLNGIEVLDAQGQVIPIQISGSRTIITATPRDMNSIPGHGSDHRTLDKLFDGVNDTSDDKHMWLIPFNKGEQHTIEIDFGCQKAISAIRFFNYNKSFEDALRGTRQVIIKVDGKLVSPRKGVTLRKSSGNVPHGLSQGQLIRLPYREGWSTQQIGPIQTASATQPNTFQEYEPVSMPIGFNFKFNFYSTHGDFYYLGLNGIEMFDQTGKEIFSSLVQEGDPAFKVEANPEGVHALDGMENDVRIVNNLFNGRNQTESDGNMWLAPFKNTHSHAAASASEKDRDEKREPNFVQVILNQPVAVSAVRFWNYAKTPERGVNEFEIEIDGKQVFRGYMAKHSKKDETWQSAVIFAGSGPMVDKLLSWVYFDSRKVQNVHMVCEGKVLTKDMLKIDRVDERLRPGTKAIRSADLY